jgi:hypothetical protein
MGEAGMKIAGATLSNVADGKLEEQFQDALAKVFEALDESKKGGVYEVSGNEIVCKIPMSVEFALDVESRVVTVRARAGFVPPKRKLIERGAFLRDGAVLVEETRQDDLPLGSNVAPIRGVKNGGDKA